VTREPLSRRLGRAAALVATACVLLATSVAFEPDVVVTLRRPAVQRAASCSSSRARAAAATRR
jgi:hypothetical protein